MSKSIIHGFEVGWRSTISIRVQFQTPLFRPKRHHRWLFRTVTYAPITVCYKCHCSCSFFFCSHIGTLYRFIVLYNGISMQTATEKEAHNIFMTYEFACMNYHIILAHISFIFKNVIKAEVGWMRFRPICYQKKRIFASVSLIPKENSIFLLFDNHVSHRTFFYDYFHIIFDKKHKITKQKYIWLLFLSWKNINTHRITLTDRYCITIFIFFPHKAVEPNAKSHTIVIL